MATLIRFTKDFPGSVETRFERYATDDEAVVSDFAAGQLVGSGVAEAVPSATDPHSPMNLAGVDGKPLSESEPEAKPKAKPAPKKSRAKKSTP